MRPNHDDLEQQKHLVGELEKCIFGSKRMHFCYFSLPVQKFAQEEFGCPTIKITQQNGKMHP